MLISRAERSVMLHPLWVRERSTTAGSVDATNRQRLVEPLDMPHGLAVVEATPTSHGAIDVVFCDGHRMELSATHVTTALGDRFADDPPAPEPWTACSAACDGIETFDYRALTDASTHDEALLGILDAYFRRGWFLLSDTPPEAGALHEITAPFGRISATNFGTLFDVRTEPVPADLAYTPVALSAHTDQPYRRPAPALQFLHTIVNDAPGGASTVVDGLAAVEALAIADPEAFEVLTTLPIEFRYDIGTDVKTACAPLIELHPDGALRQLRYSPRLDFAPATDPEVLDIYYRGRRLLACMLNDTNRQAEVRMRAGDVIVVDNHRVLHGRTAFDPSRGSRHLQGCYIDHDGPETAWRLAMRRTAARRATQP